MENARLPSLFALRCFESAARLQSFARAADELHLTPGAISRAVRLLEEDLGVGLFERRSRRVFLTDAGTRLAKAVSEGFGGIGQAVRALRADARRARSLVLSCEPTLLMRWLIPRWSDFQACHPGLDIHLVAGGGAFSFDHGIDLAIRRDDFPRPDAYHAQTLFMEKSARSAGRKRPRSGSVKPVCAFRRHCCRRRAVRPPGGSGREPRHCPILRRRYTRSSTFISACRLRSQALA